jgi:hypothetical protein
VKIVHEALHVLAVGAEIAHEPGDRLGPIRSNDASHHLPARARQSERRDEPVATGERPVVRPEEGEGEFRERRTGRASGCVVHMVHNLTVTLRCHNDHMKLAGTSGFFRLARHPPRRDPMRVPLSIA